jgi:hypothetical protein
MMTSDILGEKSDDSSFLNCSRGKKTVFNHLFISLLQNYKQTKNRDCNILISISEEKKKKHSYSFYETSDIQISIWKQKLKKLISFFVVTHNNSCFNRRDFSRPVNVLGTFQDSISKETWKKSKNYIYSTIQTCHIKVSITFGCKKLNSPDQRFKTQKTKRVQK